ncbi:MAG: hypothetical protein J3Q66DRAFT_157442 [Benniella sp.]|nr:MAG: hypothetical protein J3Q66DRAFT_157442 [Benniella sp.]
MARSGYRFPTLATTANRFAKVSSPVNRVTQSLTAISHASSHDGFRSCWASGNSHLIISTHFPAIGSGTAPNNGESAKSSTDPVTKDLGPTTTQHLRIHSRTLANVRRINLSDPTTKWTCHLSCVSGQGSYRTSIESHSAGTGISTIARSYAEQAGCGRKSFVFFGDNAQRNEAMSCHLAPANDDGMAALWNTTRGYFSLVLAPCRYNSTRFFLAQGRPTRLWQLGQDRTTLGRRIWSVQKQWYNNSSPDANFLVIGCRDGSVHK